MDGQKCYKVLQGFDSPCDFCTSPILKEGEIYTWEYTNPLTQRHYILKDRLIQWKGRAARMELAFDTTESEKEKIDREAGAVRQGKDNESPDAEGKRQGGRQGC